MNKFIGLMIGMFMFVGNAQALLIDDTYTWQNEDVIDFSEFISPNGVVGANTDTQIGTPNGDNIKWNGTRPWSQLGYTVYTPLGSNGAWNSDRYGFAKLGATTGVMSFTFNEALNSVGGFINTNADTNNGITYVSVFSETGATLEVYSVQVTIGDYYSRNDGEFWGITRAQNDIYGFAVSDGGVVLDDLTYTYADTSPVPEPCTMLLFGTGLAGLVGMRKKLKK